MEKARKPLAPVLKWAGGKRQLISSILPLLPRNIGDYLYVEPFLGGGAMLFHLQPKRALVNDYNEELINAYQVIKTKPSELIRHLQQHQNNADYFYRIRSIDRSPAYKKLTAVERASRIIYLNKTCFNGLYRVNSAGAFNAPFGRYKNPNIVNADGLQLMHEYLNNNDVQIMSGDYHDILKKANKKSFVYLDPPYHPVSSSSSFTGYVRGGWNEDSQRALKKACDQLNKKGVKFLLSNSATAFIVDLYKDYSITIVKASRAINSNASDRGVVDEVLVRNYKQ